MIRFDYRPCDSLAPVNAGADVAAIKAIREESNLAIENGTWEGSRTTPNGKLNNSGSYTASWRKVDGAWKIRSELFVGLACEGADC